jgi:MATE family multidrug resistance protein
MIGGFLLNIPLNYILIFGNFGCPELGVQGAAIASLGVNSFMALCAWVYTAYKLPEQALFVRLWRPDWNELVKMTRLGVPIAVTSLAEAGLFSTSSIMMGWLGTVPLAAHGIVLSITSLTFVFHLCLSGAATIQAGQAYGKGDLEAMERGALSACLASLGFVIITVILFLSLPKVLVSLFVDPNSANYPQILAYGVVLLAISALFSTVDAAQVMALGLLRGLQDTSVPMAMAVFSYWIIGIPVGYWLCFVMDWGGVGLWAGLAIGLACAAFTLITRFILLMKRMRFAAHNTNPRNH